MWISKRRLQELRQEAYEAGIQKGWELAQLQYRQAEQKGVILSGVLKEVDMILKKKGV